MANIKSAKKRAKTNIIRHNQNNARKSEIKTLAKKVLAALASNNVSEAKELLRTVESKIARAGSKGVLKKEAASRKISRLAHRVAQAETVAV